MTVNRLFLLLVCASGIVVSNLIFAEPKNGETVGLLFENLLPVFVVWLGFVKIQRIPWSSRFSVLTFVIFLSVGVLSDYAVYRREVVRAKRAVKDLASLSEGLREGRLEEIEDINTANNSLRKSKSPLERITMLTTQFLKDSKRINDKYNTEINAIGWSEILDVNRLSTDENLQKSEFMVERAFQFASVYKQSIESLSMAYFNDIEELFHEQKWHSLDPDLLKENAEVIQHICNYELEIVNEVESLVQHLKRTRKKWYVEDGQILFTNDSAFKKYNDILSRLQVVVSAQNQLKVESQKKGQEQLNKFLNEK